MNINEPPHGDLATQTSQVFPAGTSNTAIRLPETTSFTGMPTLHNVIRHIYVSLESGAVLRTEFFYTTEMFDDCNFVGTLTLGGIE